MKVVKNMKFMWMAVLVGLLWIPFGYAGDLNEFQILANRDQLHEPFLTETVNKGIILESLKRELSQLESQFSGLSDGSVEKVEKGLEVVNKKIAIKDAEIAIKQVEQTYYNGLKSLKDRAINFSDLDTYTKQLLDKAESSIVRVSGEISELQAAKERLVGFNKAALDSTLGYIRAKKPVIDELNSNLTIRERQVREKNDAIRKLCETLAGLTKEYEKTEASYNEVVPALRIILKGEHPIIASARASEARGKLSFEVLEDLDKQIRAKVARASETSDKKEAEKLSKEAMELHGRALGIVWLLRNQPGQMPMFGGGMPMSQAMNPMAMGSMNPFAMQGMGGGMNPMAMNPMMGGAMNPFAMPGMGMTMPFGPSGDAFSMSMGFPTSGGMFPDQFQGGFQQDPWGGGNLSLNFTQPNRSLMRFYENAAAQRPELLFGGGMGPMGPGGFGGGMPYGLIRPDQL